jgi:hypothetical protein
VIGREEATIDGGSLEERIIENDSSCTVAMDAENRNSRKSVVITERDNRGKCWGFLFLFLVLNDLI